MSSPGLHQRRALDAVLQLAHVARPGVARSASRASAPRRTGCPRSACSGEEVLRERHDVVGALGERRHAHLDRR